MKISTITVALFLVVLLTACNTVKGAGEDIEELGSGVENVAEDTEEKIED